MCFASENIVNNNVNNNHKSRIVVHIFYRSNAMAMMVGGLVILLGILHTGK